MKFSLRKAVVFAVIYQIYPLWLAQQASGLNEAARPWTIGILVGVAQLMLVGLLLAWRFQGPSALRHRRS